MPVVFFLILIVLIAQVGFWNTLGAILGAVTMIVLLIVLLAVLFGVGVSMAARRSRRLP